METSHYQKIMNQINVANNILIEYDDPVLDTCEDCICSQTCSCSTILSVPSSVQLGSNDTTEPSECGEPAPLLVDSSQEKRELLNSILPPRHWEEDGKAWRQQVSAVTTSREDVINFWKKLDTRLKNEQARDSGICAVRREIYMECFDELIRQVTLNSSERGLLLLRIRDEMKITIETLQNVYYKSIAFSKIKAVHEEEEIQDLKEQIKEIKEDIIDLGYQLTDLQQKIELDSLTTEELIEARNNIHTRKIEWLGEINDQLEMQLEIYSAFKENL